MPTFSRAMASEAASSPATAQVCSVMSGMAQQAHVPDGHGAPLDHGLHLDHCPFCLAHGGSFGLPPTAGFAIPIAGPASFLPFLFLQGPRQLHAWTDARPRAPPELS